MQPPRYMELIYVVALFSSVGRLVVIVLFVHFNVLFAVRTPQLQKSDQKGYKYSDNRLIKMYSMSMGNNYEL
jgi:hypothetical protein